MPGPRGAVSSYPEFLSPLAQSTDGMKRILSRTHDDTDTPTLWYAVATYRAACHVLCKSLIRHFVFLRLG